MSAESVGSGSHIKSTLVFTARALVELGVTAQLNPEVFRVCKFNEPSQEATRRILRALHDLCFLALCGFDVTPEKLSELWTSGRASEDKALPFVQNKLVCWGCPYVESIVISVEAGGTMQSRPLLLALGWLIKKCNVFGHYRLNLRMKLHQEAHVCFAKLVGFVTLRRSRCAL